MSGVVFAVLWTTAPFCEGGFCLVSSLKAEANKDREGASELPGAGREFLGVTAQESAPAPVPRAWLSTPSRGIRSAESVASVAA